MSHAAGYKNPKHILVVEVLRECSIRQLDCKDRRFDGVAYNQEGTKLQVWSLLGAHHHVDAALIDTPR